MHIVSRYFYSRLSVFPYPHTMIIGIESRTLKILKRLFWFHPVFSPVLSRSFSKLLRSCLIQAGVTFGLLYLWSLHHLFVFFFHYIEVFGALPRHRLCRPFSCLSDTKWASVNELGLWIICFIVHFPLGGLSQSPDLKWMVPKCVLSAATFLPGSD